MEFEVVRKKKEYKSEFLFGELEERKEIKKDSEKLAESKEEILKKYIEGEEFKRALDGVNSSQLNRFYSILEGRNFSFQSKEIEKFVKEQIERNEENKGTKEFYEFFKKNFLENSEFQSENKKNRVIFEMIKRYVRYSIGAKKLKEEKLDGEKGEN
ncbi:MAG: hypothetical protein ACLVH9_12755 [Fusobacterium sp.]|uniref:hypothetical protein n=1 Tax=Fusobacterium sp. TaxID=68766 RepID=UPI00399AF53F